MTAVSWLDWKLGARLLLKYPALTIIGGLSLAGAIAIGAVGIEVAGELLTEPRGNGGFGYDPLFYFPALGKTFAELPLEQKRQYSHRGNAFREFLNWFGRSRGGLNFEVAIPRKSK